MAQMGSHAQGLSIVIGNAIGHKIFAEDALVAKKLPGKDGGANAPKMRSTTFVLPDGTVRPQSMQNSQRKPKGLIQILRDRDLPISMQWQGSRWQDVPSSVQAVQI